MKYDAPPAQVHEMLADPAFRKEACEAAGDLRYDVSITPEGAGMRVVVDQTQSARGIPSFATKFVGDEIRIVQTEDWSDDRSASLHLAIPGKPGRFTGTISLEDDGSGGTVETVAGELTVNIPLVGGKLEALIVDLLTAALRSEERVGRSYLAG